MVLLLPASATWALLSQLSEPPVASGDAPIESRDPTLEDPADAPSPVEPPPEPAPLEQPPTVKAPTRLPPGHPTDPRVEKDDPPAEGEDYRWSRSTRPNIVGEPVSPDWDAELIINSDRPDFTDVLPSVPKNYWQTESGYSFKHRRSSDGSYDRHQVPETLLRLGITDRLELRLRWDSYFYARRHGEGADPTGVQVGSDFLVGFKWQAVKQKQWRPAHTLMGTFVYRVGNGGLATPAVQPGINWVYGWQVTKWLVLRGSTGFETVVRVRQEDGDGNVLPAADQPRTTLDLHQSVVAYWQVSKRLGAYTEWFSFYDFGAERQYQENGGVGLYIYITPNVQFDVRGGGSFAGSPKEVFTGAGLSLRGDYHEGRRRPRRARA
jgi:outer membrane putative beta-barrel porin/alpha-amylase